MRAPRRSGRRPDRTARGPAGGGCGGLVAAQPGVGDAEVAVGVGLGLPVTQPAGGGHGSLPGCWPGRASGPAGQEVGQGPGQAPGVGVETGAGGLVDRAEQDALFGGEPGHGGLAAGKLFRGDPVARPGENDRVPVRVEQAERRCARCAGSGPASGRPSRRPVFRSRWVRASSAAYARSRSWKVNRPGTCSVTRCARASSASSGRDLRGGHAGQAGGGRGGDVRTGMQAQQPEQPRRGRAQGLVGPGEHRPHVGGRVRAGEGVQAAARARAARRRRTASGNSGWVAARAATIASASGSRAHRAR